MADEKKETKKRPWDVTLIGVLTIILGVSTILGGLAFLLVGSLLSGFLGIFGAIGGIAGLIFIGLGILNIIIGINLLKGKNWSRIITIAFLAITFVFDLVAMIFILTTAFEAFSFIINLIILILIGLVIWDLWFRKEVKEFFKS